MKRHQCSERCKTIRGCAVDLAEEHGGMSLREVAAVLGIKFQSVQYIERRALGKLRAKLSDWRAA